MEALCEEKHEFVRAGAMVVDGYDRPLVRVRCVRCGVVGVERYRYLGTFIGEREVFP